ncbi:hypothetical protein ACOSQ2_014105 [Xanthoceras sorbifolium]
MCTVQSIGRVKFLSEKYFIRKDLPEKYYQISILYQFFIVIVEMDQRSIVVGIWNFIKGKKCKLLHWVGNGEVVVEAEVDCTDPQAMVHHMSLGPDYWRVCVKKILMSKIPLYRATTEFIIIEHAKDSFIT